MTTKQIELDRLIAHPDNANRMPEALQRKLREHMEATGRYPPIIVRAHPQRGECFEILDGHHRVAVLREIGAPYANCDIWDADDEQATLLLLTLNRLHGEDDPLQRGRLMQRLIDAAGIERAARLLPDTLERIGRLVDLAKPASKPAAPPDVDMLPRAVTFFLTAAQRDCLNDLLAAHDANPSSALIALLQLDGEPCEVAATP